MKITKINPLHINAGVESLNNVFEAMKEYYIVAEQEKTKRTHILAARQAFSIKINAQKELMMSYLDKSFDERKSAFQKHFDNIDKALEKDDIQALALILHAITDLAKISPLNDLKTMQENFQNPDFEYDF